MKLFKKQKIGVILNHFLMLITNPKPDFKFYTEKIQKVTPKILIFAFLRIF